MKDNILYIFQSLLLAATTLKLSGDDIRGMFASVESMLTKKTVTKEALRGRLSEYLPGAYHMASYGLEISHEELSEGLEKEILDTNTVLVAIADVINERYRYGQ